MNIQQILNQALEQAIKEETKKAYDKGYEDGKLLTKRIVNYNSICAFLNSLFCENSPYLMRTPKQLRDYLIKAWRAMLTKSCAELEKEFKDQINFDSRMDDYLEKCRSYDPAEDDE